MPKHTQIMLAEYIAALRRETGELPGVTWTSPAKLHITLKFLGHRYEELEQLSSISFEPFTLRIFGLGKFPNVFFAVPQSIPSLYQDVADPLQELHKQVQRALGQESDSPFIPHVTLAKNIRGQATWAALDDARIKFNDADLGRFRVTHFELLRSGRTANYEVIQTYPPMTF
jgi:2'-5' RNA ligase